MKKILKILFAVTGILLLIIVACFAYLNFVYFPQLVKAKGAAWLEEKSKGRIKAETIQYIPLKGAKLERIIILSGKKEPLFTIDKLYLNVHLMPLITQRNIAFRLDLYPAAIKKPFIFTGLYRIRKQKLDLNFKLINNLFAREQTLIGKTTLSIDKEGASDIALVISSPSINIQGKFHIKEKDLVIEKLTGTVLQSGFDLIGDVQNLNDPLLNIYGDMNLNLADIKGLNPEYTGIAGKLNMQGQCTGKVYLTSKADNPEIGLKMAGAQVKVENIGIDYLSVIAKVKNKTVLLDKLYAKFCDGEINLQASTSLDSENLNTNLDLNIFNLELNKLTKNITGKDIPVHGRFFALGQLNVPLKEPRAIKGKMWLAAAGSNLLQLPVLEGIAGVLRLPELRKIEFKEAGGNFTIARQQIKTDDFKVVSKNFDIYFKGYMDFAGNLGFDIQPSFSRDFLLASPNIGNILGVLIDSAGNFMGEIKLKGNISDPRYTFKPISTDKLFRRGIEEGLKHLFKFKKKED